MDKNIMPDAFRSRFIVLLISFLLIAGGSIGAVIYYLFPEYFSNWYFGIMLFYFVVEIAIILVLGIGSEKLNSAKLTNLYMGVRVVKMILAIAFIALYALIHKEDIKSFVIVFMLYYFLFMVFNAYYIYRIEKRKKDSKSL